MAIIRNIAIHHAGGFASNPYGSSRGLTWQNVNEAHKARWNFESMFIPGSYGGYNFIYDPKDHSFHQFRAIGEETAAQIGYNFDTLSICIIGNYSIVPGSTLPADRMDEQIEKDIALFTLELIAGNFSGIKIAPNTKIDLSILRAFPHRHYQPGTECYGTALTDSWIQNVLSKYTLEPHSQTLQERLGMLQQLLALYMKLNALIALRDAKMRVKGASPLDRECEGLINN